MKSSMLVLGILGAATIAKSQPSTPTVNQSSSSASSGGGVSAGTISLGGGIGYSSSTDKNSYNANGTNFSANTKSSHFAFRPAVGYFIAENLELGLGLGYTSNRRSGSSIPAPQVVQPELGPTRYLYVGPYVRYYQMVSDRFGVTGAMGGGFQSSRSYGYDYNRSGNPEVVEYNGSGLYANLTPAIVFFPVPRLAVSASFGSLNYNRTSYDFPKRPSNPAPSDYESISSGFGANFGLDQLAFGGTYYFGR